MGSWAVKGSLVPAVAVAALLEPAMGAYLRRTESMVWTPSMHEQEINVEVGCSCVR